MGVYFDKLLKTNSPSPNSQSQDPGAKARLNRIINEMERGLRFIETFDESRVVTFYGSARATSHDSWYHQAYSLSKKLAFDDNPIAVCTGGGPGIMEAGNKGAFDAGGYSIGLGIELPNLSEDPNQYTTHRMNFYYFFARKMVLVHIAQAHIFFPGGVGTMDEFFELVTLIATKKITNHPIIVLVGVDFWKGLLDWMKQVVYAKYHAVSEDLFDKFYITDNMEEAYKLLDTIPSRIEIADDV
ncbi:MAG: TIGR00730 family Rossman fold protein [Candidatus Moraniibacteriota bacterium]|nr:MAG: TIGR00730 family Rossman fold protein [Candidatus Moranbacteria bacterium]